ncbi:hypothetical protein GCG54_00015114 [Colletotrichum gloeosporioides]|uniref:Uncharacterized protein n=1 Tax=Colletotrichum gloeosporioides TaxID=474922 RepID=A0A8H4CDP3_COLGL|nr:uncharacterized protein GCG54_00015114 [Colletotrichum gloeosporioides]KAF3801892.1 hypothetical protein GCG54_00015114 [Colletotrichum gloeosporioides]
MSKEIPTLQDRSGFPAWQKATQKSLTPYQWEFVTCQDGGPSENPWFDLSWENHRAQAKAYMTILYSIPYITLVGLGAHDELTPPTDFYHADYPHHVEYDNWVQGGCPRPLYNVICKWFKPTRAMIAAQVRCIANTDPAKYKYDSYPAVVAELAKVDYKKTFAQVLNAIAPTRFAFGKREPRAAERKRVADDTSREAKRIKTEPK